MLDIVSSDMRYPEKVKRAFRRVIGRSLISDLEAAALLGAFGRIRKRMG
jgi:tRNA C32,U32 (ribose-2'-O)-methylase TrmJ